jgi:hypothetical protein
VTSQEHSGSRPGKQLSDKDDVEENWRGNPDAKSTTKRRGDKFGDIQIREEQFSLGFFMLRPPAEVPGSDRTTPPFLRGY